jgi:hypothetical protein
MNRYELNMLVIESTHHSRAEKYAVLGGSTRARVILLTTLALNGNRSNLETIA